MHSAKPVISSTLALTAWLCVSHAVPVHTRTQDPASVPAPLSPQIAGAEQYRAEGQVVPVAASVTDGTGRFVDHLTREDFEVRDNGRMQAITVFTPAQAPLNAVILLDGS